MAALAIQWQSWVAATEKAWPAKPKIYYLTLYRKPFASPAAESGLLVYSKNDSKKGKLLLTLEWQPGQKYLNPELKSLML